MPEPRLGYRFSRRRGDTESSTALCLLGVMFLLSFGSILTARTTGGLQSVRIMAVCWAALLARRRHVERGCGAELMYATPAPAPIRMAEHAFSPGVYQPGDQEHPAPEVYPETSVASEVSRWPEIGLKLTQGRRLLQAVIIQNTTNLPRGTFLAMGPGTSCLRISTRSKTHPVPDSDSMRTGHGRNRCGACVGAHLTRTPVIRLPPRAATRSQPTLISPACACVTSALLPIAAWTRRRV